MKTITTTEFFNYLNSLNLFRITIKDLGHSFEALLSNNSKPDPNNFTQIYKDENNYTCVRLSKKDLFNEAITKGFFN